MLIGRDGGAAAFGTPVSLAQLTAAIFIVVLGLVNLRGVHLGAIVQNVSTALKVAAMVGIVGMGVFLQPDVIPPPEKLVQSTEVNTLSAFGLAMVAALWAYDGWSDVGFVSGEVKDPGRSLPIA